jgi:hypothetical protein
MRSPGHRIDSENGTIKNNPTNFGPIYWHVANIRVSANIRFTHPQAVIRQLIRFRQKAYQFLKDRLWREADIHGQTKRFLGAII